MSSHPQAVVTGNSYNDLCLLSTCTLRIAMNNAVAELKVVADHVAPSEDEDGLAVAILGFLRPIL